MERRVGILLGLIAAASGLLVIFRTIVDTEIAIGFVTISFGVLAVIWTWTAIHSLSRGSSLRSHITHFLFCLFFILLFSIWHTLSKILRWRETINEFMLYPGYLFITLAFIIFVITSYHVLSMSKEFGFEDQANQIREVMDKKKKKKR